MSNQQKERTDQAQQQSDMNIRVNLIRTIWGCATGMLGISIPLVALSHSPIIPFFVIVGATVSTAAIWLGKGARSEESHHTPAAIGQERLNELEERVANMEAISLLERRLAERDIAERSIELRPMGQQALEVPGR